MTTTELPVAEKDRLVLEGVACGWLGPDRQHVAIRPMTPDASLRRYFRLQTGLQERPTVVAVVYDSLVVPEANANIKVNSYDSFVLLGHFFRANGLTVPEILFESKDPPVILLEDLGDVMLADVLLARAPAQLQDRTLASFYEQAIDQIYHLQRIQPDLSLCAYQRTFGGATYVKEMFETLDYILTPKGIRKTHRQVIIDGFELLGRELEAYPTVLAHRDFHSWNLMIDPDLRIRVIDYQDALLATNSYDVVGLLNDRDTDSALGRENYIHLVNYFADRWTQDFSFFDQYDRVLLQRDLKVAGRFVKLAVERGLESYRKWTPGTLTRIGRTLERLTSKPGVHAVYSAMLEVMSGMVDEIRSGADDPIRFE